MKKLKLPLFVLILIATIYSGKCLNHILIDGFTPSYISSDLAPSIETPTHLADLQEAQNALKQNFYYLASGSQSYVFVSEDNHYVLKFFKHKRWRLHPFWNTIPLPSFLNKKRSYWIEKKQHTIDSTLKSCQIAYLEFKQQTQVVYLHLNQTKDLNQTVTLFDRMRARYELPLDRLQFLVQKKAIPTNQYLLDLKQKNQREEAKQAIHALLVLLQQTAHRGYHDKDPHLIRNFGFIDDKPLEIDVGGFYQDPKKGLDYFYNHQIDKIATKLIPWLSQYDPELVPFTEKEIADLRRQYPLQS